MTPTITTRLLSCAVLFLFSCAPAMQAEQTPRATARVERVVDGDTIIVVLDGKRVRVRLIGIDTPEVVKPGAPVQCFGRESSAETHRLLDGQEVVLEYDRERLDRFRRTLAYVHRARDDLFVNEVLVARGFARVLEIKPNAAHSSELDAAERAARAAHLGLWSACSN